MTTLTIRLPKQLRTDLDKISRAESKAVSDIVMRPAIATFGLKFRAVRRKILPFAEAQGLLTDEDVFDALS